MTVENILATLTGKEQIELYKALRIKYSSILPDDKIIWIADTGYTSRLVKDKDLISKSKEYYLTPFMITDSLWGAGVYFIEDEKLPDGGISMVEATHADIKNENSRRKLVEENSEIFEGIEEIYIKFGKYGRVFFYGDQKSNPNLLIRELEYCQNYGMCDKEVFYISEYTVIILHFDTESG